MRSLKKTVGYSLILTLMFSTIFPSFYALGATSSLAIETPVELPVAKPGQEYSYQFQAEGGLAPLHWKIIRGDIPEELTLAPSGKLFGRLIQSQPKTYVFTVEVKDSSAPPPDIL